MNKEELKVLHALMYDLHHLVVSIVEDIEETLEAA
jgi:hypothetical protein